MLLERIIQGIQKLFSLDQHSMLTGLLQDEPLD
jgi:hypothetical protein